jgi:hypothetical protein
MAELLAKCIGQDCSMALASALIVWYAVLGFLVGYLATRIYLAFVFSIADRMATKGQEAIAALNATKEAIERIRDEAQQVSNRERKDLEVTSAVMEGLARLSEKNPDPKELEKSIHKLEEILLKDPAEARAAVVLARLYRHKKGDLKKAIEILTRTADAMEARDLRNDRHATLVYNRACYNVQLGKDLRGEAKEAHLKSAKVLEDLELAFQKSAEEFARFARSDTDLSPIGDDSRFRALLAKYDPQGSGTPPPEPPANATSAASVANAPANTATAEPPAAAPQSPPPDRPPNATGPAPPAS